MTARHELLMCHESVLDAVKTLCERRLDAVLRAVTRKFIILHKFHRDPTSR